MVVVRLASSYELWGFRVVNTDHIVQRRLCKAWISAGNVRVALGGFMGTGKSSVGARLAQRLGTTFVDMDIELERLFGPITDQFKVDGEQNFRIRESQLLESLASGDGGVVATGGGVWVTPANRPVLEQHFICVLLTAPLDTLLERVGEGSERPLWGERVQALYAEREVAYAWGDIFVNTHGKSVNDVVEEILKCLRP